MSSLTLALLIFGLCYLLIMTERLHKTIVALFGAAVMISLGVVSQEEAFYSHEFGVDYNVVFLLIGMMVIVNIVRETGLFEVLAIWAAQRADAKPFRLLVLLAVLIYGCYLNYDIRKVVRGGIHDYTREDPWSGAVRIWVESLFVFCRFIELLGRSCCK